jgi:hypothetical protein
MASGGGFDVIWDSNNGGAAWDDTLDDLLQGDDGLPPAKVVGKGPGCCLLLLLWSGLGGVVNRGGGKRWEEMRVKRWLVV